MAVAASGFAEGGASEGRGLGYRRGLAWLYVLGGLVGLVASGALTLEKIAKLRDPGYVPSCSLNPVLSCGSVMDSAQAAAFGFPNPLIGIAAFAVVVTVGVVGLLGFRPPVWFRGAVTVGAGLGTVFVHWLIYSSLYDIHALCPYCMVVWVVTIPLFWYSLLDVLRAAPATRRVGDALGRVHSAVLALWYVAVVALIAEAFWDYWSTLV